MSLPGGESQQQWTQRVRRVVQHISEKYDVHGLCFEFALRLDKLVANDGEGLRK